MNISAFSLLKQLYRESYRPNFNTFTFKQIGGIHPLTIFGSFLFKLMILVLNVQTAYHNLLACLRLSFVWLSSSKLSIDSSCANVIFNHLIGYQRVTIFLSTYLRMAPIFYTSVTISILGIIIGYVTLVRLKFITKYFYLKNAIGFIGIIGILLSSVIQQTGRMTELKEKMNDLQGKNETERIQKIFNGIYTFAKSTQSKIKGQHHAIFLSDLDHTKELYMLSFAILKYHLYPVVTFNIHSPENNPDHDTIILIKKDYPEKYLPDDYQIIETSNDHQMICAVRRNKIK